MQRNKLKENEVIKILQKANLEAPSKEDRKLLLQALEENPHVWKALGDLNSMALQKLMDACTTTVLSYESLVKFSKQIRNKHEYSSSSHLEKMLIDQIVLTYMDFHWAQQAHTSHLSKGTSIQNAKFLETRVNGAHRRYLRSIETLARIRKMGVPALTQINITNGQTTILK